jgi:hypothetical protein
MAIWISPPDTSSNPVAAVTFVPIVRTIHDELSAPAARTPAIGRMQRPALSGEYPRPNCRNWVWTKRPPSRAKTPSATAMTAILNRRDLKKTSGSIGWSMWCSQATKPPITTSPANAAPRTLAESQPSSGPSMIAHRMNPRPLTVSSPPRGSGRRLKRFRESGTSSRPPMKPATTTGMLTRKIDPHQKRDRSNPPATGPMAIPRPIVPDQIPTALPR